MDILQYIAPVFSLEVMQVIALGTLGGMIIGALPGLTATMGVALLIPLTFGMEPVLGLNMLIGIYIGGIYGGCISSILLRTPGTPASAATCLDGYPLAQKGQAGKALAMATIASFVGGIFAAVVLATLAPQLAAIALKFGPAEYFALALFGLTIIASLSGDLVKGAIAGLLGVLISTFGADPISGTLRYTFGVSGFASGFAFTPALIGLFALSEVFVQIEKILVDRKADVVKVSGSWPSGKDLRSSVPALIRGSVIGTILGIVPGTGSGTASWIAYNETRRSSKTPELFGTGHMPGVAATESANNAVCAAALIPLLALGVPGDVVTAVMMGGLMIHGLAPGPVLFQTRPDIIIGMFAGTFQATIFMFIFGMLGIRLFSRILLIPKRLLVMSIVAFCFIGSFAINLNVVDLYTMVGFGVLGYGMQKFGFSQAALCIALILGPMAESNLRRGLLQTHDNLVDFLSGPITLVFLGLTVLSLAWPLIRGGLARRRAAAANTTQQRVLL
ncbi:C4-dicarboxylate ABC transporter permease [Roseospira marina]|uniref:C4-dicarboxylate ABC transporter permease n=1 Tax=Roseospira marina TaxID=140057 RepID=A0A5M6I7F2_9PROT|nr:tripartite tricarboxylate transporter permease [Roseospira marina]KAA5604191.1 C4-dicarboxylate ABC transporter permease [Roseospira marina]MBB4315713.1 putative tricarboxylic transport membrane protein [Roseospira marina]MBB5088825.1 putative tricarboxylic transport membrane protein [Roseospira marina]